MDCSIRTLARSAKCTGKRQLDEHQLLGRQRRMAAGTGGSMTREQHIQKAVLAALGCTKIDYRSPKKLDEAAAAIARFVEAELSRVDGQIASRSATRQET